jgi:phosphoribosylanthranilate isomerase
MVDSSDAHPPTRVKVCGITNLEDAELAVSLGSWALGMIFYEGSPRAASLEQAQRIGAALRRKTELCGVFVNAPLAEIVETTQAVGLTLLQLHGEEGPSFCSEVARRTGARVIKAAQVSGPGLLDARSGAPERSGLRGGTGETFDWDLLAARRSKVPLILSGGLHPQNVAEAIALARPWAVDTASGTEAAPGHKDAGRLRAFFDAVQAPAADASKVGQPA